MSRAGFLRDENYGKHVRGQLCMRRGRFNLPSFRQWAERGKSPSRCALEPFDDEHGVTGTFRRFSVRKTVESYNPAPADEPVRARNTMEKFPESLAACAADPLWFARDSSPRRGRLFITRADESSAGFPKWIGRLICLIKRSCATAVTSAAWGLSLRSGSPMPSDAEQAATRAVQRRAG